MLLIEIWGHILTQCNLFGPDEILKLRLICKVFNTAIVNSIPTLIDCNNVLAFILNGKGIHGNQVEVCKHQIRYESYQRIICMFMNVDDHKKTEITGTQTWMEFTIKYRNPLSNVFDRHINNQIHALSERRRFLCKMAVIKFLFVKLFICCFMKFYKTIPSIHNQHYEVEFPSVSYASRGKSDCEYNMHNGTQYPADCMIHDMIYKFDTLKNTVYESFNANIKSIDIDWICTNTLVIKSIYFNGIFDLE